MIECIPTIEDLTNASENGLFAVINDGKLMGFEREEVRDDGKFE